MIVFEIKVHYSDNNLDAVYRVAATNDVNARARAVYLEKERLKGEIANLRPVIRFCEVVAIVELSE